MPKSEPHMIQIVDLQRWHCEPDGTIFYDRKPEVLDDVKHVRLPMDFPGYLRALRITKEGRKNGAAVIYDQVATTLELDCFGFGVKLYVRAGRDGTLKIFTEDADGRELIASYTREKE